MAKIELRISNTMNFDHDTITLIWLIGGASLMVLELLIPGLIVVFFGISAVIVGLLNYLGIVTDLEYSLVIWFTLSLISVLFFRKIALRFFPSESTYQLVEEDVDVIGSIVTVITDVSEDTSEGRIEFQGTSWPAVSNSGTIKAGDKAKILYRDNISWVVEICDE